MGATDLTVKVGANLTGFKTSMAAMPGIAKPVGIAIAAAFAVGTAAILKAAKVGSEFEQTLTETATVAQAFGKELKALEDKARELGRTTAFTATESAKGMYALASAGLDTRQIVDSVEYAMKLAGATGSEMSQATGLLAASMKQFGLDASESKRITDTFASAITNSQLTMERLSEGMKYAGTTGAGLGWSIEETTAALAQFANLGLEGSMAGTNLRMAMVSLTKQTDQMQEALSQMGLTFKDVNPETHNFGEILKILGKRSITTKQAIDIFGARAALNMKQLSKAAVTGKADFEGLLEKLIESQEGVGRTTEMYDRMMDTFHGKWVTLKSAISDLFISFFNTFRDSGRDLFESWTLDINNFAQFIRDNGPEITGFFEDLASVINAAAKTMLFFIKNTSELIIKLHELKDQTVKGVEETAGAFKESWNYIPKFFNDLVMAWYDLADEIQKKDLKTFFKEQFLESGRLATKFVAETKTNQEALDKIMKDLDPTYFHTIETLKKVADAADDTYTDWQDVSEKTTKDVISDTRESEKALEELEQQLKELDESIRASNANPWDPIGYDVDTGPIDKVAAAIENATGKQYDYGEAVKHNIVVQDDLYDQDYGHWYDGMSKATQMWGKFTEAAENTLETARKDFLTLEQAGKQMMESFIENSRNLMGDVFYDVMTGKFDDINEAFSGFFDGILKSFTNMLGEMVANDILKGGLKNVLGVGLAGAAGYYGAGALGGNQASQNLAATGAIIGAQYGNGYGALIGGIAGFLAGSVFGGGDQEARYSINTAPWARLNPRGNMRDYTVEVGQLGHYNAWGDAFASQMTDLLNKGLESVGNALETTINSVPVELRKKIVSRALYMNNEMFNLGYDQYSTTKASAGEYQAFVKREIDKLAEKSEQYLNTIARSMGKSSWEEFEKYMIMFETASQTSAGLIGDAFREAFDSETYTFDAFKDNLYDAIFNTVKDGMINAFLQSEAFRAALNPFFMQFQNAIEQSMVGGFFNPQYFQYYANAINTSQLVNNINALKPVLDILSNTINTIGNRIYGRAEGGPVYANRPYIVGEEAPELFVPETDGHVYPQKSSNMGMNHGNNQFVFINKGVMTESEFFYKSLRNYQDYRQGDTLQTVDISAQGLRLG